MADYTKSPVFSSPSYWIALGVGVVGIGAAAVQERRGSAARYTVRDRNRPDMIFDPDIPKKITLHSAHFFRDALTESPFEVDTSDARMLNVVRDYLNARGFQFDPVEIESTHEDADEGAHFSIQDRASNLLIAIDEQRGPIEVYRGNHGKMKKIGEVYEGFSASKPTSAKALKSLKKIEGLLLKSRTGSGSAAYRPYTSYGGDPYWMNAKYAGTDAKGLPFKKGERVFYYPKTKTIYAGGNAEAASHDFQSMAEYEEGY